MHDTLKDADYWFRRGLREMEKSKYNRYTLAIGCFKKANKICSEKRTYEKLFQCYVRRNKYDFVSQIDLYLYNEGMYELNRGDLESAIEYFKESNFFSPNAKTYERLYQCYIRTDEFEKAYECIKKAYIMRSNHDKIACEYAGMLIKQGQWDKARRVLMKVLRRNGTYKSARDMLENIK